MDEDRRRGHQSQRNQGGGSPLPPAGDCGRCRDRGEDEPFQKAVLETVATGDPEDREAKDVRPKERKQPPVSAAPLLIRECSPLRQREAKTTYSLPEAAALDGGAPVLAHQSPIGMPLSAFTAAVRGSQRGTACTFTGESPPPQAAQTEVVQRERGPADLFGDDATAAAMIDRLVHHAEIVALKGDSYRLKTAIWSSPAGD